MSFPNMFPIPPHFVPYALLKGIWSWEPRIYYIILYYGWANIGTYYCWFSKTDKNVVAKTRGHIKPQK